LVRSNFWIAVSNRGVYILGSLELLDRCFESHWMPTYKRYSCFPVRYATVVLSCSVRFLLREPSLIRSNNFQNKIDKTLWI
jgi:hypothetical protein